MDTLLNTIVELVKQGGPYALWGITIWGGLQVVRLFLVVGFLYLAIRMITNCISTNYKVSKEINGQRIALVSKEVSDKLSQTLESFRKEYGEALEELRKQMNDSYKS